jgi:drug/metabolite transporter (DMT)-like permease
MNSRPEPADPLPGAAVYPTSPGGPSAGIDLAQSQKKGQAARSRQWRADGSLLIVTLIWGSTFVMVKGAVEQFPVMSFLALRFALATAVLLLLFGRRLRALNRRMVAAGLAIGVFLFVGYTFQTVGLQYTTASKAGFITGLSVVILSALLLKRAPSREALAGIVLSTVGLALLTLGRDLTPQRGDLIVLGCAFSYAFHIVAVSQFAPQTDAVALTIVQVGVVAVLSATAALFTSGWGQPVPGHVWLAAAFTGILATALAFGIQNQVQTWTSATHTALIFACEPVFAALFGYLLAGERLSGAGLVGCGLILLGMLMAELRGIIHLRTRTNAD